MAYTAKDVAKMVSMKDQVAGRRASGNISTGSSSEHYTANDVKRMRNTVYDADSVRQMREEQGGGQKRTAGSAKLKKPDNVITTKEYNVRRAQQMVDGMSSEAYEAASKVGRVGDAIANMASRAQILAATSSSPATRQTATPAYSAAINMLLGRSAQKREEELKKNGVEEERAHELATNWGRTSKAQQIVDQDKYDKKKQAFFKEAGDDAVQLMREYLSTTGREKSEAGARLREWSQNLIDNEGKTGAEAHDAYWRLYQYVTEEMNREDTEESTQAQRDFVNEYGLFGAAVETAGIPGASLVGGVLAAGETAMSKLYPDQDAPVNTNSRLYALQNWADTAQEASREPVADAGARLLLNSGAGQIALALGKTPEEIIETGKNISGFLYDTGVSTATSALSMAVGGEIASALGYTGQAARSVAEIVTLPTYGTGAFAETVKEMQDKGASKEQAIKTAFGAGIAEMAFEKLSLDKAWDAFLKGQLGKTSAQRLVRDILVGAGIEGLEEVNTDLANWLVDASVNGEFSDFNTQVQMLVESGMDPELARKKVIGEYAKQAGLSFAGGAISGGVMNAGSTAAGQIHYHNTARQILQNSDLTQRMVQTAKESMPEDSTARKVAEGITDGNVSEQQMSQILESMSEVAADQNETGMEGLLQREFEKLGEDAQTAAENAQRIMEIASTEEFTEESADNVAKELAENKNLATVFGDYVSGKVDAVSRTVENAYHEVEAQKRTAVKFETVKAGETPMVQTASGKVVPMTESEVSPQMRSLWNYAAATENTAAANAMIEDYDGGNIGTYALMSIDFFNQGRLGVTPFEVLLNDEESAYEIAQSNKAHLFKMYSIGENAAKAEAVEEQPGRLSADARNLGEVTDLRTDKSDQGLYDYVEALAKRTGLNFTLTDSMGDNKNGSFSAALGRVTISADTLNAIGTGVHELSEFGKAYAPEKMDLLINKILEYANTQQGMDAMSSILQNYRDTYRKVEAGKTIEQAGEEFSYDFLAGLIMTEDGQKAYKDWVAKTCTPAEQKTIAETMRDLFGKIAEMIRNFLATGHVNPGTKAGLKADAQKAEELRNMWMEVIDTARENLRSQSAKDVVESDTAHYIEVEYESAVDEELLNYVDEFVADPDHYMAPFVFDGKICKRLADEIQDIYGVSAEDYEQEFSKNQLRHIEKDHGKNGKTDHSMADPKDIARIKYVLDNFDRVRPGDKLTRAYRNNDGTPARTILLQKKIGDKFYYVVEAVPDAQKKRLGIVTAYINKKDTFSRAGNVSNPAVYVRNEAESDVSLVNSSISDTAEKSSETSAKHSMNVPSNAEVDSDGRKLSADQIRFFANSKVRDDQGRLLVMYHGTPNGDFTVFRGGSYFSDMEWYADKYQSQGASMLSYKKNAKAPKTYAVYLNIEKPFDTRLPEVRKVFEKEFYKKYGTGTPLQESGLPDWTDAEDLREFIEENGLDYDGIIVDEGGFPDGKGGVTSRGVSYIPLMGKEQVKSVDNLHPTENEDIRFSMDVPVEETRDLIAVHNITEDQLMKTLELGGFPMPSIAVTKLALGHDMYGEISVLFRKNTIDPKASSANKVYSGDAYTPEFPRLGYKLDSEKVRAVAKRVVELLGNYRDMFGYHGIDTENITDRLESNRGDIVEAFGNREPLKYAYTADKGIKVDLPMKEASLAMYFDNEEVKKLSELFTKEEAAQIHENGWHAYEELKESGKLDEIVREINEDEKKRIPEKLYERLHTRELTFDKFDQLMNGIAKYKNEGVGQIVDKIAFGNAIDEVIAENREDYEKWLTDLFKGVVLKTGIRNKKDTFMPSGNRRSWDSLHDDYTLANIVKAMKAEQAVGAGVIGYSFFGSANREFSSIDDIRSERDRLQIIDNEEYSKLQQEIANDLNKVATRLASGSSIGEYSVMSDIGEAVAKYKTAAGVKNFLSQWYRVTDKDVADIMALKKRAAQLPTGYFEAKPRRAVGFNEIASVILPSNAEADLISGLDERSIPYVKYKAGNSEDRLRVLNQAADEAEDVVFSLNVPDVDSEGRTLSQQQKDFFRNSKIRDEEGRLKVMYHGAKNGAFTVFNTEEGAFFSDRKEVGQIFAGLAYIDDAEEYVRPKEEYGKPGPAIYKTYVNAENPLVVECDGRHWNNLIFRGEQTYTDEIVEKAINGDYGNYDSVVFKDIIDGGNLKSTVVVALKPNQAKSIYNETPTDSDDIRYSLQVDANGKTYVEIDDDITSGFSRDDEIKAYVKEYMKEYFPSILMNGYTLPVNSDSRKEFTDSDYTKMLERRLHDLFVDKMRMAANLDEIVNSAEGYKYEKPKHPRNDDKIGFVRGKVQVRVGAHDYLADVILADRKNAGLMLYDIIKLRPTTIRTATQAISPNNGAHRQAAVPSPNITQNNNNGKTTHSMDVFDDEIIDEELAADVKEANSILQEGLEAAKDFAVDAKIVKKVAKDIKEMYRPTMKLKEVEESIGRVFTYLQSSGSSSKEDLLRIMKEVAEPILEETEGSPEAKEAYETFRNYFKGKKVALTTQQKLEVKYKYGSIQELRNRLWGAGITISDKGTPLDVLWPEIADMAKGYVDVGTDETSQPEALEEAMNVLRSGLVDHNTDTEASAYNLALDIYRRCFEEKARIDNDDDLKKKAEKIARGQQNFLKSQAKKYQKRYKEATDRLKKEREINLQRIADEIEALTEEQQKALMEGDVINEAYLAAQKLRYEKELKALREQRDDKIAQVRAQAAVSRRRVAEERKLTEYKERLRRNVDELNNMLAHPTEHKHVPADLIKATVDMLSAINMDTGNNQATRERLKRLADVYARYKDDTTFQMDYDERTAENIKRLQELFKNRNYTYLSASELYEVIQIVRALKKQIRDTNRLLDIEKYKYAKEAAQEAVGEVRGSRKANNPITNALDAYGDVHLNSYRWFRKTFGYKDGAGMAIWKGLDEGQLNMLQIQREINDIFRPVLEGKDNQKEVKKLISTKEEDLVDVGLTDENGLPVKVTKAMRLSILMHAMNGGNLRHMVSGGLTVPDLNMYEKNPSEAYARGRVYRFTDPNQLIQAMKDGDMDRAERLLADAAQKIKDLQYGLSEWEKRFLEASKQMFHNYTGDKVNETSMKLKGYTIARVANYFPIKTDPNFVTTDLSGLIRDGSLEGMGFLKERVFSKKPMLLEDITNVIARQTKNVSMYAGLAVPLRNLNMVLNQTYFDEKNERRSVKEAIRNTWGDRNIKWLQNLMQDVQGGRSIDDNFLGHFMDQLRGHYAGAVLTLNPSVAIKQAASYPTAAAVLGWKPLFKAIKDMGKGFGKQKGLAQLEERNPLLWYRSQGYGTQELADIKEHGGALANLPKGLKWIEWMDTGTIRTLEYASKYYVDEHTDLKEGTKEYWDAVSETFTRVVEETQPNYTPLQQADIIRNPNKFLKQIIMFKTQPMQNFGIVYDAAGNLTAKLRDGSKEEIAEAKDNFAKAVSSQVVSSIVFSAMTILASMLLHKQYKYKDDDDKVTAENILKALGEGMISNVTGALVLGSEIYEGLKAILTGETYYGVDASTLEMITDIVKNTQSLVTNTGNLSEAVTEEEHDKAGFQVAKSAEKLLMTLAQFGGLPLSNVKNILRSMYQYEEDIRTGQPLGSTESRTASDIESQYNRMTDALLAGNEERYARLESQLVEGKEKSESTVTSNVISKVKERYEAGEITRETAERALEALGKTPDEAYFKLEEWSYEGEGSYGTYKNLYTSIDYVVSGQISNRGVIEREVKDLTSHGKEPSAVASQITKEYKPKYLEAVANGNAANLKSVLITAYQYCGLSREEAIKKIDSWK